MMETNKQVVRDYMQQVLNEGNTDAIDQFFATEAHQQWVESMMHWLLGLFPDLTITIEDQIAEGDIVTTRATFSGTHTGENNGIPPTGKRVTWTGIAMDQINDGKVVNLWHEADILSMMQQIDAVKIKL